MIASSRMYYKQKNLNLLTNSNIGTETLIKKHYNKIIFNKKLFFGTYNYFFLLHCEFRVGEKRKSYRRFT